MICMVYDFPTVPIFDRRFDGSVAGSYCKYQSDLTIRIFSFNASRFDETKRVRPPVCFC